MIKAFLGKNDETYNIADSKEDTFQLILSLVCDLETEEEVDIFIQDFLNNKATGKTIRSELGSVFKNSTNMLIYSRLTKFPMFKEISLAGYTNFYQWRKITNPVSLKLKLKNNSMAKSISLDNA